MHSRATDRRSASKCQGKCPDQTLDQAFGLSEVLVAVSTSRLSCKSAGKTRTLMPVWDSSGESRFRRLHDRQVRGFGSLEDATGIGADLASGACLEDLNLQSEGGGSRLHIFYRRLGIHGVGRIDENGRSRHPGYHFAQEPEPLCCQLRDEEIDTRRVASWSSETCDQTELHWILANAEDDREHA